MSRYPNAAIRQYRREQLQTDGSAISVHIERLVALLTGLRIDARLAEDTATGEAMLTLADEIRDASHGPVSAMLDAHERATDELGMEPAYTLTAEAALTLGFPIDVPLSKQQLQDAVDAVAKAFVR